MNMNCGTPTDEDEPLFMSLVSDLFPNVTFEQGSHGELEEAVRTQVEEQGLIFHEPWVLKIMQVKFFSLINE